MTEFRPIRTAVITGQHPFDVPEFYQAFRSLPEIDFYPQSLEDFAADAGKVRDWYQVVVFYNFHQQLSDESGGWWEREARGALERLGESSQGLIVLHHGLAAFRDWPLWSELCGIEDRRLEYHFGQVLRVEIADPSHPIVAGMEPFEIVDETYLMADPAEGSHALLTTTHPLSMRTLAWTRTFRNAPVLCYQSGHDAEAFRNSSFRQFLGRGIRWLAGMS